MQRFLSTKGTKIVQNMKYLSKSGSVEASERAFRSLILTEKHVSEWVRQEELQAGRTRESDSGRDKIGGGRNQLQTLIVQSSVLNERVWKQVRERREACC